MVEVMQADREAVDAWREDWEHCRGSHYALATAFVRHRHTSTAASEARIAELEGENATLRHWAWGHIDALLLYAAGSYPNDSHVKEAVAFCRLIAPGKKLRMDPLAGSDFHPARQALTKGPTDAK